MDEEQNRNEGTGPGRGLPRQRRRRMGLQSQRVKVNPANYAYNTNKRPNNANERSYNHNDRQSLNRRNEPRRIGFLMLQNLAQSDSKEIISQINDKKEGLMNLLQSPIERLDVFALVLELLVKISHSSFDQLKLTILLDVCNSAFILNLRNYLMDLPYTERKSANNMYWKKPDEFWGNFVIVCECITSLSPSIALAKCRSLIDGTSKLCLEGLNVRHNYQLPDHCNLMLIKIREALTEHEKKTEVLRQRKNPQLNNEEQEPPENFRQLSIVPRLGDLVDEHPYLRSNVVKGRYRDVEHYLDVQFRLFREDCFGPLREGIRQFIQDPTKKRYDHVRVFRNVKFVEPYVSTQDVGSVVEFDGFTKRRFKNMNWNHNKRLIYGSLVLFTKDNCKNLIVATILDRNIKYLENGKVPVAMVELEVEDQLYKNETYTMFESEVYFEPYYHVLKSMQDPSFPKHMAMQKYIIDVNPEPQPAAYLAESITYTVETNLCLRKTFKVLDFDTWPSSEELNLNESQYEAYKMAITHEFAVIQGPPGTGKTYLGVKVAKTFLENLSTTRALILLVCYTNHALDQFLEAILPITDSIVRIGNQSRNEAMEKLNLHAKRKQPQEMCSSRRLFCEQKHKLKECILKLKRVQESIQSLNSCVLSYHCIKRFVPESIALGNFYKRSAGNKDPLYCWLFEHVVYDFNETIMVDDNEEIDNTNKVDDIFKRHRVDLDDLDIENLGSTVDMNIQTSFSVEKGQEQIKHLISRYKCETRGEHNDLHREIIVTRSLIRIFNEMRSYYNEGVVVSDQANIHDLKSLSPIDRWMLYFKWTNYVANHLRENIQPMQNELRAARERYEESRMIDDYNLLKNHRVIGMTTSGAARLRKLIIALAPPIVIVEEAAEVLEQHIITSLTDKCKHLILIGDHQQLRPSASYMKLAKHYNIEVSLFERMIMNDIHSRRLTVQHRMRPQISALITPAIYSDLQDHPSVHDYPNVRGVTSNVFFFTHNYKEEVSDDITIKTNKQEGDMVLGMANYLMQQDYSPEDVTILAAYTGQMFYMRKQRTMYRHLSKVKITVVDNYQGEESKIILLSLVRNNDDNKIGFLGTENRICVALSRAKEGMYIFGNIEILKKKSPLWTKISATLENHGSLGTSLQLICENHRNQVSVIKSPEDYSNVPEGGCLQKCNYNLPCLHACPLICHGYDRGHKDTKCILKCSRIICDLNHVCPLMCMEECKPCEIKLTKKLPCGHDMLVACHLDPNDPKVRCLTLVLAKLPSCGHEVKKSCFMATELVSCPVPCGYRVDKCGHVCTRSCHVNDDPDHERYLCQKPCAKAKKGCTKKLDGDRGDHQCVKYCYEDCDDCNVEVMKKRQACKHKERVACSKSPDVKPCYKNCARALPCGHFCKNKCYEPCVTACKQQIKKRIPECNHEVMLACELEPVRAFCKKACERTMTCGHRCLGLCGEDCKPEMCKELLQKYYTSPCGHKVQLPCNVNTMSSTGIKPETLLQYCKEPCGKTLACDHECMGTCASCKQGRLHVPCVKTCHQINICGHQCKEPCNQVCPPCREPCEVKCQHSRCRHDCSVPCVLCQENCARACFHSACKRRCSEACIRAACVLPCPRTLACGHPCRGLCGELCPNNVCKQCHPEDFPTDFLENEFDDDAMFIVLEDCGHVMEFEDLENLMKSKSDMVQMRRCPYCRKSIINTPRYKDIVNNILTKEINPIKERVYGNKENILIRKNMLLNKVADFHRIHSNIYKDSKYWKKAFEQIQLVVKSKREYGLLHLDMYFVGLNILELLSEIHVTYETVSSKEFASELQSQNKMICNVLTNNVNKISLQQQADIKNELNRMNAIVNLSKIISHNTYLANKVNPEVIQAYNMAKTVIFFWGVFEHEKSTEALNELKKTINATSIATQEERKLIIKAIGAKAGQWFKCPNNHFYSIGQCGGAMETGRCVECKAKIGGTNHRLLSTNAHAGEFDNSRYAAYSEEANNMANFDLL